MRRLPAAASHPLYPSLNHCPAPRQPHPPNRHTLHPPHPCSNLQVQRVNTWEWQTTARVVGTNNFEMPYDGVRPVRFQMAAVRGPQATALVLTGDLVIEK